MKILIAEDEATSSEILKVILSPYGECIQVYDGEQAVTIFEQALDQESPFDLICMDIMMPNIDGQEALRRIRAIEKARGLEGSQTVKVIMTTALEDQENVIEAFYKGSASAYVNKPIEKDRLLAEIGKLALNE